VNGEKRISAVRVLYVNSLYAPNLVGGAERVMQTQAEAMRAAGHEVAILALSPNAGLHQDFVNGIPVWRAGIRNLYFPFDLTSQGKHGALSRNLWHLVDVYNPLMASYVRKVVKEFRPEVASVHNLAGWSIAVWDVLTASRIPIVQVLHDQYLLCATSAMFRNGRGCVTRCGSCRVMRSLHRYKSPQVDTLVGVSQFISDKLRAQGYFEGVRSVRSIPNVRNISGEEIPTEPRCDDGTLVLGYIGRLSPAKGIEFLLDVLTSSHVLGWKLLIAGSGDTRYEEFLRGKFRDSRIEFLGAVEPKQFFPQIDITVIPSLWEDTLPSVAFESLLYGRPILGSRIGGIPEMVNSRNGRVFSPGDGEDLLRGIVWATENRMRLRSEVQAIQTEAAVYADKERWVKLWSEVYSDAIAHHRGFAIT
jgi:glycosyltransferase involved in cell wall biosynthesis